MNSQNGPATNLIVKCKTNKQMKSAKEKKTELLFNHIQ